MNPGNREKLAQSRAERAAQTLQDQQEANQAAVRVMGERLGAPVDFSKGVNLGRPPLVKAGTQKAATIPPINIPQPPKEAFLAEAQQQAAEQADYEASMQAAGIQQEPPVAVKQPFRKQETLGKKIAHPLLLQLREEFGIGDSKPLMTVMVASHEWTFVPLTPDLIAIAARIADRLSSSANEHALRTRHAAVCCSVVAMDGVPIWQMFGFDPTDTDDVKNPLVPRGGIRTRAAFALFAELTDNIKNRLLEALFEAYTDKIDREGDVLGYADYEDRETHVWACPNEDCTHKIRRPDHQNEQGEYLPYYCEVHGEKLDKISSSKSRLDDELSPLP